MPWYIELQNHYKDAGLSVIGISLDEDGWRSVKPFLEDKKITYTVVLGTERLAEQFGIEALPMTFLIDREGRVASTYAGIVDKSAFERKIRALLRARVLSTTKYWK